eukprot:s3551_g8.t1
MRNVRNLTHHGLSTRTEIAIAHIAKLNKTRRDRDPKNLGTTSICRRYVVDMSSICRRYVDILCAIDRISEPPTLALIFASHGGHSLALWQQPFGMAARLPPTHVKEETLRLGGP